MNSFISDKRIGMEPAKKKRSKLGVWIMLAPFALLIGVTIFWIVIQFFFGRFGNEAGADMAMSLHWINVAYGFIVGISIASVPFCAIAGIALLIQKKT